MEKFLLFLSILFTVPAAYKVSASSGSIELDDFSFNKIINAFSASLVKFDVAFPYGDKHDAFVAVAKEATDVSELVVAEVGVKDYGEKDNEQLARKYGATKENFPVVKLFLKGNEEPITFDDSQGFTTDQLRRFVRQNTGIYLSLPGCIRDLDMLAIEFMKSAKEERSNVLKKVEVSLKELAKENANTGKIYKTIMEKILEKGDEFVKSENQRIKKVMSGKLSDEKKQEMGHRLNILQSFQLHEVQYKDEL
ncbi:protein windbeutel [Colias croceus]|uniref:protein windbeutel n=1 Tax=Colias crocea TaxID=72248 RepID=UPI001E27D0CD|nr:protein windbeutel [Colias croceus]